MVDSSLEGPNYMEPMQEPMFELHGPDGHIWRLFENGRAEGFPVGTTLINGSSLMLYGLRSHIISLRHFFGIMNMRRDLRRPYSSIKLEQLLRKQSVPGSIPGGASMGWIKTVIATVDVRRLRAWYFRMKYGDP